MFIVSPVIPFAKFVTKLAANSTGALLILFPVTFAAPFNFSIPPSAPAALKIPALVAPNDFPSHSAFNAVSYTHLTLPTMS